MSGVTTFLKSNIIIITVLITILSTITFGINKSLESSEADRKIEVAKIQDKESRREADRKIANAPLEAW